MGNTLPIVARDYSKAMRELHLEILSKHSFDEMMKPGFYRMLLHLASLCFKTELFYWNKQEFLLRYLSDLGSIKKSEARRVASQLIRWGSENEDHATSNLKAVLQTMRVRMDDQPGVCLSPSVDEDLYLYILGDGFITPWSGHELWKPEALFDFSSSDCKAERDRQLHEDRSNILDVQHGRNACMAVLSNAEHFECMNKNLCRKIPNPTKEPQVPIKPPWRRNSFSSHWKVFYAAYSHDWPMFAYILYLLPELMAVTFSSGDIVEYVVTHDPRYFKDWEITACLEQLHELGCDLNVPNLDGWKPIEVCKFKSATKFLRRCGCCSRVWNDVGESKMETNTRKWNAELLEKQLDAGADVLEPHPRGGYFWMPWVIKNKYYGALGFDGFQLMVRERMRGNRKAAYYDNKICREIIARPLENCATNDAKDLLEAVKANDISRIKVLLALGAPTEWQNQEGQTCLVYCAENGLTEAATLLLQNFANPNRTNKDGENCFRVACLHGHFDVAAVLHRFGTDINDIAIDGLTVCHLAYNQNSEAILQFCLDEGCDVNKPNADGFSLQYLALRDHKLELAATLQSKYHGDVNTKDAHGNTPAYAVLQDRNIEHLKHLIQMGVNLDSQNNKGLTLFMEAVAKNDQELCEILLALGSNINIRNRQGYTLLMEEYQKGNMQMVQFLLDKGCDTNIKANDEDQRTALIMAVAKNDLDMCDMLLSHGANINLADGDGNSPILFCARANSSNYKRETFDYLISKGCSINQCNRMGAPLLGILLAMKRDEEARRVLQMKGAKVRFPESYDEPIVHALERKDPYWLNELVMHGANAMNTTVSVVERYLKTSYFSFDGLKRLGQFNLGLGTPLQTALEQKRMDVVMYLWENADARGRRDAGESRDSDGQTPLLRALWHEFSYEFAGILIDGDYGGDIADKLGYSPILLAAKIGNMAWTETLYRRHGVQSAGAQNSAGRSALHYAAEQGWESMCDDWFIRGVDITCVEDDNGIISKYRHLEKEREKVIRIASKYIDKARSVVRSERGDINRLEKQIQSQQGGERAWLKSGYTRPAANRRDDAMRLEKQKAKHEQKLRAAEEAIRYYERQIEVVENVSRQQLFQGADRIFKDATSDNAYRQMYRV